MKLKRISLTNVVTFEEVELPLDLHPLVVVTGANLDSEIPNNPNGAGKSVLWNTLPNLAFENDPMSLTRRTSKKSVLGSKDSQIEFEWEFDGKITKVKQTPTKYHVEVDGVDLETHKGTQAVAREWIAKMFPLSEAAYYTYAHLTPLRPHPFQRQKPADRMAYITEMFDLSVYDALRQYFAKKVTESKRLLERANVLASELQVAETEMNSVEVTKGDVEELRTREKELHSKVFGKYSEGIAELASTIDHAESRAAVQLKIKKLGVKGVELSKRAVDAELESLGALHDALSEYREYQKEMKRYRGSRGEIVDQLAELDAKLPSKSESVSKLRAQIHELEGSWLELEAKVEQAREAEIAREDLNAKLKRFKKIIPDKPKKDREYYVELRASSRAQQTAFRELLETIGTKKGDCKCPTCMQSVALPEIEASAERALKDRQHAEQALLYFDALDRIAEVRAELKELPEPIDMEAARAELKAVKRKGRATEAQLELCQERERLTDQLERLEKPKKVDAPDTELTADDVFERGSKLSKLSALLAELSRYKIPEGFDLDAARKRHAKLAKDRKKALGLLSDVSDEYRAVSSKYERRSHALRSVKRLRKELASLGDQVADLKLYEMMQKSYSGPELKADNVNNVLQMLSAKLNELHPIVYTESMTFDLSVNNKGGIDAQVTRNNGRTSDISMLSGAESSCFALLWALTMLTFTSPQRRPSFIILDEPDQACSPALRRHLVTEFLPQLMSIVPHVFWVTPLETELFGDAVHWKVEKQHGVSTVIM